VILLILVAVALAGGYLGWLRNSSLVAVTDVKVTGVTSQDREQMVAALTEAGKGMTTLHVQGDELASVAGRFPTVAAIRTDTDFPHGLTIHVMERTPVLVARSGDRAVPVGADGELLSSLPADGLEVPTLIVDSLPAAGKLEGDALEQTLVVGAAPDPLRPLIDHVAISSQYGVVVTVRGGIALRFGPSSGAHAKWAAVAAVLADPKLTAASYFDVRVPERPAVGGAPPPSDVSTLVPPAPATDPATTATTTAPATTTPTTTTAAP
jgi:cell division protein FtsQ